MIVGKQCTNCSFDIVATQFYNWLKTRINGIVLQKIGCNSNIEFIDVNLWWRECREIDNKETPHSVIRGDSPYLHVKKDEVERQEDHALITTSHYNARLFEVLFKHVEVIPHPYDPDEIPVVDSVKEKKFDAITIGYNTPDDHKGLTVARNVAKQLDLKFAEVSNECGADVVVYNNGEYTCYRFMSLSRHELYKLIAQSRFYLAFSHTEGFGLPVLEAMVAGTVPIYVNGHAFAEYAMGIPIRAHNDERPDWFNYECEDVVDAVKYAMSLDKKEYELLSEEIKNTARLRFDPEKIYKKIVNVLSTYYRFVELLKS